MCLIMFFGYISEYQIPGSKQSSQNKRETENKHVQEQTSEQNYD